MILDLLMANLDSVIIIVAFILICLLLIRLGYGKFVESMLLYLVGVAEEQFGDGTGPIKKAAVITWLYDKMPAIVKLLFTKNQISELVEIAVTEMKKVYEEKEAKLKAEEKPG